MSSKKGFALIGLDRDKLLRNPDAVVRNQRKQIRKKLLEASLKSACTEGAEAGSLAQDSAISQEELRQKQVEEEEKRRQEERENREAEARQKEEEVRENQRQQQEERRKR